MRVLHFEEPLKHNLEANRTFLRSNTVGVYPDSDRREVDLGSLRFASKLPPGIAVPSFENTNGKILHQHRVQIASGPVFMINTRAQ